MCGSAPTYTADEAINICGFGRFQWFMLVYAGMAWMADAMEIMVLSFLGAAVSSTLTAPAQPQAAC
jgi:hypothetical protein